MTIENHSDHDRLIVLETAVSDSTKSILLRIDELGLHWSRQCDLRHAEAEKKRASRLTRISLVIAMIGMAVSTSVAIGNCLNVHTARASQPVLVK